MSDQPHIAVVGLGYVGLPLALAFARHGPVTGFDVDTDLIAALAQGTDPRGEVTADDLTAARFLTLTADSAALADAKIRIVAVPTPVDENKAPDLAPLRSATQIVAAHIKPGTIVVYETTVYPGCTEEICAPILEAGSGLTWKKDFHIGYSPERVNPGDDAHGLAQIVKIVAGDTPATLDTLANLYSRIIEAGIHRAPSIAVAEAAKVIENVQRDINIGLMNELSMICRRIGIDTHDVLEAAGTKWNFMKFHPDLVGGHRIGVDPYYLTHLANRIGHNPEIILAGRRLNDFMGSHVAEEVLRLLKDAGHQRPRINILGVTFKADVGDIRNTKVADVIRGLNDGGADVTAYDPWATTAEFEAEYGLPLTGDWAWLGPCNALVIGAPHSALVQTPMSEFSRLLASSGLFADVLGRSDRDEVIAAGFNYWRL